MKVLIAAGGTGGHIYPGIAVAREILARDASSEVLFVGTARGLETKIVPDNGFQLALIHSSGLKTPGIVSKLKGLLVLPQSFLEARVLLKEFRPHVVIGAGGYVSGPVLLMASIMGYPTLVMESNALPGFTNRQLARFIDKAALTFAEALRYFGKKGVVTGNPVRKEFFEVKPKERTDKFHLLVFGGSQGARAINSAIIDALPRLSEFKDRLTVTHQTGEVDFEKVSAAYEAAGWQDAEVQRYLPEIVKEFEVSDLVICRAGATTCAELAAAGRAALMVPLPTAADDHQRRNAEALVNAGAAKMVLQADLSGEVLAREIAELVEAPEKISAMERSAKAMAKEDAAAATADLVEAIRH
jgi:UDP-N-acetylglucosamine--N-acetylmuramyl-(pentapeptide) pyrophosphoryl-undecaprenol N-acetylglucosamine transferase